MVVGGMSGLLALQLGMGSTGLLSAAGSSKRGRDFHPVRVVPEQRAITDAPVIAAGAVRGQVTDKELVLGVVVAGQARAYPINMLTGPRREIINDTLGGKPIAATW